MRLLNKVKEIADAEAQLKDKLIARVAALPQDNPRVKMLSPNCCIARSSDVFAPTCGTGTPDNPKPGHSNWSAEYHMFKPQYDAIIARISRTSTPHLLNILESVVTEGRVVVDSTRKLSLHPDVIEHIREVITSDEF